MEPTPTLLLGSGLPAEPMTPANPTEAVTQDAAAVPQSLIDTQPMEPVATSFTPDSLELPSVTPASQLISEAEAQSGRLDFVEVKTEMEKDPETNSTKVKIVAERGADGKLPFVTYVSYLKTHALDELYKDAKKLHSYIVGNDGFSSGSTNTFNPQAGRADAAFTQIKALADTAKNLSIVIGKMNSAYTNLTPGEIELKNKFLTEVLQKSTELSAQLSVMRQSYPNISMIATAFDGLKSVSQS